MKPITLLQTAIWPALAELEALGKIGRAHV